jgi:hypothetical protein
LLLAVIKFIRETATEDDSSLDLIVELGLIENVNALLEVKEPEVAYEAAWVITNLAGGKDLHCQSVLASGCHTTLVKLLEHEKGKDVEQVITRVKSRLCGHWGI